MQEQRTEGPAHSPPGFGSDPNRAILVIPAKGPAYYVSWLAVAVFGFLMAVSTLSSVNLIVSIGGFGAFVLLGLAGVFYFRTGRTFEADLRGVRLTRGRRVVREIAWPEVKRVRYGIHPVSSAPYMARPGPFLSVSRYGAHRGIEFDTADYPRHPQLDAQLAAFAADVARLANLRGVSTEWKDYRHPAGRRKAGGSG